MSRIAGILMADDAKNASVWLRLMLANLTATTSWHRHHVACKIGSQGWCGWHQPNAASIAGVHVVIDGRVYNRRELLDSTATDAELLISLYLKHGFEKTVCKLNGDFAISLFDEKTQTLWLARDRFGVKPLYYFSDQERLAFASRPRALLNLPGVPSDLNRRFIMLFAACHYRYIDNNPDETPYAQIRQLPAAHLLRIRNGEVTKIRYWSLHDLPDYDEPEDQLAEGYRELLQDAVSLRIGLSQRPAFTLSSGMDSSSVLACAVRVTGSKQEAFSTVYTDQTYDESDDIRSALDGIVERWHPLSVDTPDVFALVRRMIEIHDEPVATATWLSHFLLCEQVASQGFGALFGGLGGDELNAGEYEHFLYHFADLYLSGDQERLEHEVRMWITHHDHPIFRKDFSTVEEGLKQLVDMAQPGRCLPDHRRLSRYASVFEGDCLEFHRFKPVMDHPFGSYLKNRTYQDIFRETIPCCLRAQDRQNTAFNLENFSPFLDHRLVEFMFRIPGSLKIRDGVTKILLRKAMCGIVPEPTRTRIKKTGWNAPAHLWFSGPGREHLLDLVHSCEFRTRGIYRLREVQRIIDEHEKIVTRQEPRENHMMFLWQLVNLELWLQQKPPNDQRK